MYISSSDVLNGSPNLFKSRLALYLYDPILPPFDSTQWGNQWPLITPTESKINGVMMSRDKNRLNLV